MTEKDKKKEADKRFRRRYYMFCIIFMLFFFPYDGLFTEHEGRTERSALYSEVGVKFGERWFSMGGSGDGFTQGREYQTQTIVKYKTRSRRLLTDIFRIKEYWTTGKCVELVDDDGDIGHHIHVSHLDSDSRWRIRYREYTPIFIQKFLDKK